MLHLAKPLFAALVILVTGSLPARPSTIIYNNGSPNQADAEDISEFIAADDFVLSSSFTITGATFWASADLDPFVSQFSGIVGWGIFANNEGEPSALLASGYDSNPTLTDTGNEIFGTQEYKIDFALTSVALTSGSYWLGLHESSFSTPDDGTTIYWDTTGSQTGSLPMVTSDLTGSSGWFPGLSEDNLDLAFELSGSSSNPTATPEPNMLLPVSLFGVGCLLLHRRHAAS